MKDKRILEKNLAMQAPARSFGMTSLKHEYKGYKKNIQLSWAFKLPSTNSSGSAKVIRYLIRYFIAADAIVKNTGLILRFPI